jgi:hypothetical protein
MSRRLTRNLTALAFALLFSALASADSITTITFFGSGANRGGGVHNYPYKFFINGGHSRSLLGDTFDHQAVGVIGNLDVSSLIAGAGASGSDDVAYDAARFVFDAKTDGQDNPSGGNWAIGGAFSANPEDNPFYRTGPDFSGLGLYTAGTGTEGLTEISQQYIGYQDYLRYSVPEPGSIALAGVALLAMGMAFRRRLLQQGLIQQAMRG